MIIEKLPKRIFSFIIALMVIVGITSTSLISIEAIKTNATGGPNVEVQAHVQDKGWMSVVQDGKTAGTTGESLRLESLKVRVNNMSGGVSISTHQSNVGWVSYTSASSGQWAVSGSTGKSRAIEAVKIKLTGEVSNEYDIYYRLHVSNKGWLGWTSNGKVSGSTGLNLKAEAIQVKLVKKGTCIQTGGVSELTKPCLSYSTHIQDIGNTAYVSGGNTSGTTSKGLRMEGLRIKLKDFDGNNGISYRAHVSNIGWQNWVSSDQMAGTEGRSLAIEAVQIKLSSYIEGIFDVYYRLHVQNYGWLGYAKNGEVAGTTGGGLRAEAIQIVLVNKGEYFDRCGASYKEVTFKPNKSSVPTVFSQTDNRWAGRFYGYKNTSCTSRATLSSSGCGILSYVNAVYYLNGRFIDPGTLANWSMNNGYRINGVGTSLGLYQAFANSQGSNYGISYGGYSTNYNELRRHLNNGEVAIGSAPGHLMAIVDYNSSTGKFLILDSYKSSNRGTASTGYVWKSENECRNNSKLRFSSFYFIKNR